jgi:hypothetical protein
MSNFWQRIFKLEQAVDNSSPAQPVIHELLQRSEEEAADYLTWKSSFILRQLLEWLNQQYAVYNKHPQQVDKSIGFLNTPSSKGFLIYFHQTNYTRREATHLFDYFKERVKVLNYRTQLSDTRTFNRRDWVETIEKHYLKPRLQFVEGEKQDQQFGNIMIELELRNDQVHNLRLRATSYRDHNYQEAKDFAGLMKHLLEI